VISHETKRAKKIIVELVRQAGGQVANKAKLFNAFWKAHLSYAANSAGYLSTWPLVRTAGGPAIDEFDLLVSEMLSDGWLTLGETQVGPQWAIVFALGPNCPPTSLTSDAVAAIREAVQAVDGELQAAHGDEPYRKSRVWRETPDGEEMDIYLDLVPDAERDRREANLTALASALGSSYETSRK
jgi:hypothetical protein